MKAFSVRVFIRATPERIWALLTDAAKFTRWNNTVEKVDGKIALGERVTVHPKANPGRAFPVTVAEFEPPRSMVWTGGICFLPRHAACPNHASRRFQIRLPLQGMPGPDSPSDCTVTRSPRAILPSTFSTVLFHRVNLAASVSKAQMRSGVARIKLGQRRLS